MRDVWITGSGIACAAGIGTAAVADCLRQGAPLPARRAAGGREFPFYALPDSDGDWLERAGSFVRDVAHQLGPLPAETPLFVASSSFQMGWFETMPSDRNLPRASASFALDVQAWLGLSGPCQCFSNACISGFSALAEARAMIAHGWIDEAVVIGFEFANASTLAGFASLELLSQSACRPFDAARDGLVLGEAVAAVRLGAAPARWRLAGIACGIDAWSPTGPDPGGAPLAAVAVDALTEAKMTVAAIELVKLHAAGSPAADLAEARALHGLFGIAPPPLLSLKPAIGHTLGASGIAELVALLASLDTGTVPATCGFAEPDPELGLLPTRSLQEAHIRRALLNLIGFGGGVAAAVVECRE